ncbi:hypothetical protein BG004_004190 [Podila humilis]|nr:hypothetical protein BG004_004190 [Podila humilis]
MATGNTNDNNNNLLILIQNDRKDLSDLTRDFGKADKDTQADRADKATNQVVMMINGANTVIHPPLKEHVDEGVKLIRDSLERYKELAAEFDKLERTSFEDTIYPSVFDRTFNRFFDMWDYEDRSANLLRDVMSPAEFDLLGPRWITTRATTPTRYPVRSLTTPRLQRSAAGQEVKPHQEERLPQTLSQRVHQLLEQTQEMLSKVDIAKSSKEEQKVLACGCTGTCTCGQESGKTEAPKAEASKKEAEAKTA